MTVQSTLEILYRFNRMRDKLLIAHAAEMAALDGSDLTARIQLSTRHLCELLDLRKESLLELASRIDSDHLE